MVLRTFEMGHDHTSPDNLSGDKGSGRGEVDVHHNCDDEGEEFNTHSGDRDEEWINDEDDEGPNVKWSNNYNGDDRCDETYDNSEVDDQWDETYNNSDGGSHWDETYDNSDGGGHWDETYDNSDDNNTKGDANDGDYDKNVSNYDENGSDCGKRSGESRSNIHEEDLPIYLSDEQIAAAGLLAHGAKSGLSEDRLLSLYSGLLFSMFTSQPRNGRHHHFNCPIPAFLMAASINQTNSFGAGRTAHVASSTFSRVQYIALFVITLNVIEHPDDDGR
jgi:hypothetical protein